MLFAHASFHRPHPVKATLVAVVPGLLLGCALGLSLGACGSADACGADSDCKDQRICEQGACVSPDASVGTEGGAAESGQDATDGAGDAPDDDSGEDDGAVAALCPFPNADDVATLSEGLDTAAQSVQATFSGGGGLDTVDAVSCIQDGNPPDPQRFNPSSFDCAEAYVCGVCQFWILEAAEGGFILAGDSEKACPQYAGFFEFDVATDDEAGDDGAMCVPMCTGNEFCFEGECTCADGCRQGSVCCGGSLCAGDCIGTPCC